MRARKEILVAVLPYLLAACASSPTSRPVASAAPAAVRPATGDAADLQRDLERDFSTIVSRENGKTRPVVADAEAALSIDIPDHRTIEGAVRYFSNDLHEKIQTSLDRGSSYTPMIERILDEYKLPKALAYLPVIESAYIPTLTSRSGAHGIWQFMAPTASEYGLRVDWWVDERANPEKSTRAAARYLRDLHNMFQDWPLALAAYNAGPGRISRALAANGAASFWELLEQSAIPKETRGYVPTFFATLLIVSDPPAYGFELREDRAPSSKKVDVVGPVSLAYLAQLADLDEAELKRLNPELRRGLVPPGTCQLAIPPSAAGVIATRAADARYEDSLMRVASFTLRKGDSLTRLARAIGVSPRELMEMNGLASDRLGEGDSLYVPVRQTELSTLLQKKTAPADRYYVVRKGDTLYSIARRHGLTVEELTDLNRLHATTIHPGDRLRVSISAVLTTSGM